MANLRRQYISRGKTPLIPEPAKNKQDFQRLQPNGIYAVRFTLSPELLEQWQVDSQEQWGLVMLDSMCKVRRHWNYMFPQMWSADHADIATMELYKSTKMERQFALNTEQMERNASLYDDMKERYDALNYKVWQFMNKRIIRWLRMCHIVKWEA